MTDISRYTNVSDYKNPFSFSVLFKRMLWNCIQSTIFFMSPQVFYEWRSFVLRCFGANIGKGVHVSRTCRIMCPWNLKMGNYSCLGPYSVVENEGALNIGEMSTVSQYSYLCTGTHDYKDKKNPLIIKSINIGDGVWVAADSFVGPGVKIGDLTVVGARSAVFKDLPENMVCVGNPCKPVKKRFEEL